MKKVSVELLNGCYPYLTTECITHAITAFEANENYSMLDLGAYLNIMNMYFSLKGQVDLYNLGLVPKDSKAFYDKKLSEWLEFWKVDEKSVIGEQLEAREYNKKMLPKLAKGKSK